jgi:hypothetical protein
VASGTSSPGEIFNTVWVTGRGGGIVEEFEIAHLERFVFSFSEVGVAPMSSARRYSAT